MKTKAVFFGDSLSDNGNKCRASDGKLWSEIFPSLIHAKYSYNYAICGSTSAGLREQIRNYQHAQTPKTDKVIYSLLSGGNDFQSKEPPFNIISNLETAITTLNNIQDASIKQFLIFNLPTSFPAVNNIGSKVVSNVIAPYVSPVTDLLEILGYNDGKRVVNEIVGTVTGGANNIFNSVVLENVSDIYLASLKGLAKKFKNEDIQVTVIDIQAHHKHVLSHASQYKINPDLNCMTMNKCKDGLFFDPVHLSAKGHKLLAEFTKDTLSNPDTIQIDNTIHDDIMTIGDLIGEGIKQVEAAERGFYKEHAESLFKPYKHKIIKEKVMALKSWNDEAVEFIYGPVCVEKRQMTSEMAKQILTLERKFLTILSVEGSTEKLKEMIIEEFNDPSDVVLKKVEKFERSVEEFSETMTCKEFASYLFSSQEVIAYIDSI